MIGNIKMINVESGIKGSIRGWMPTLVGYSCQGLGKFGGYEVMEHLLHEKLGHDFTEKHDILTHSLAAAGAETVADILLCPWETVKIKVQTVPGYGKGLVDGFARVKAEEGVRGFFTILPSLWMRQIPYTIIKFVCFEKFVQAIYWGTLKFAGKAKADYSKYQQLGFSFSAGYMAGVVCCLSHPADTLTSILPTLPEGIKGNSKFGFAKKCGMIVNGYSGPEGEVTGTGKMGLWRGIGPRILMIGTLTGLQWFIFDAWKTVCGIPTTGKAAKREDDEGH